MLLLGASGQLGTAFRHLLPDAAAPPRADFDLARPESLVSALERMQPSGIVNCAAYTAVDAAEDHEDLAYTVNATAVRELARYAGRAAIPLVTFSTDYVFAGDATSPYLESSPTDPINAYGRTKLAGEEQALEAHAGALIVRTSWVISGTHPNFVATMLRLAAERDSLNVVSDQRGRPTIATDLAAATLHALRAGVTGVLHLANRGETTWFELAQTAVDLGGLDAERIKPCATVDYPTPARRPAYSVLGSERAGEEGVPSLPHWRTSLPAVVASLRGG